MRVIHSSKTARVELEFDSADLERLRTAREVLTSLTGDPEIRIFGRRPSETLTFPNTLIKLVLDAANRTDPDPYPFALHQS